MVASSQSKSVEKTSALADTGGILLKLLIAVLLFMLIGLQYRLWVGEGSLAETKSLSDKVSLQLEKNEAMRLANQQHAAEVNALKTGLDEVEARAREELGMVKQGETFYLLVDKPEQQCKPWI